MHMAERRMVGVVVARITAGKIRGNELACCRLHSATEGLELASLWLVSVYDQR